MKRWLFGVYAVLVPVACLAQAVGNRVETNITEVYDISGRSIVDNNKMKVAGTPFAYQLWGKGTVELKKGQRLKGFELQFNQFSNEIWYKLGDETYAFNDTVVLANIDFSDGENTIPMRIRSFYPPVGKQSLTSLYEVIEEGPVLHLLKFTKKEIVDGYAYDGPQKMMYKAYDTYYLFDVEENLMFAIPPKIKWRDLPLNINILTNQYSLGHSDPKKLQDWIDMVRWINDRP